MTSETIKKAFSAAGETMRMIGHDPESIVDAGFEYLALFCVKYGVTEPVARFAKAVAKHKPKPVKSAGLAKSEP